MKVSSADWTAATQKDVTSAEASVVFLTDT